MKFKLKASHTLKKKEKKVKEITMDHGERSRTRSLQINIRCLL